MPVTRIPEGDEHFGPPKSTEELLREAQELNAKMAEELERIAEAGLALSFVQDIDEEYAILTNGFYTINANYNVGDAVLIYPRTGQIVKARERYPHFGELYVIDKVEGHRAEISIKGDRRLVAVGKYIKLQAGDVVLLDSEHKIVTALIERPNNTPKAARQITWDDIGGNKEAKQLMIEAIELPHKYARQYKHYGQGNVKGLLLKGPPGCGKTMLGKAAATSIGGAAEGGFILIKGPEVLDPYVGVTEANIRAAFARAKAFKQRHGRPAVLFIDEAESLLTARGAHYNYTGQTTVPAFLTEMDGIDDSAAIVILSTNRDDMLDPAIIREGRCDFKVEIARPNIDEAREIMNIHLTNKPLNRNETTERLVEWGTTLLYQFEALPHSGALIAGVVNKAVTAALRRDITRGRLSGLGRDDFTWAVQQIVKQELKLTDKEVQYEAKDA